MLGVAVTAGEVTARGVEETTDEPVGVTTTEVPAGDEAGSTLLGPVEVEVAVSVSVTGQMVVETAIVEVITVVESAGQFVMLAAQLVMVISLVEYTVEVVHLLGVAVTAGEVL